ncbi:MAG: hypothetical protein C0472_02800 [Erythrobacter sp.]|nr:hypothetical protein [Erythrobacter sp.]
MTFWLYRPGRKDQFVNEVLEFGWLVLSFYGTPNLSRIKDKEELRAIVHATYPERSARTVTRFTNEIANFLWSMKPGDDVLMPYDSGRKFFLGKVLPEPYRFVPALPIRANHVRSALWHTQFGRDAIPDDLRRILQVQMTILELDRRYLDQLPASPAVPLPISLTLDDEPHAAMEGTTRLIEAKLLSRDRAVVERAWRENISAHGGVGRCVGCGFEHPDRGMFDVHHTTPIAQGVRKTLPQDLVVLCPRCHRAVHHKRGAQPLSIAELCVISPRH